MAEPRGLDELTVNWTEGGVLKIRELDKVVLSTATSWATLAFLFQEYDAETSTYRSPKVSLRRYRKRGGRFVVDKHLTLSHEKQALDLARAIEGWFSASGSGRTLEVQPGSAPRAGKAGEAPPTDEG